MSLPDDPSVVVAFSAFEVHRQRRVVLREGRTIPIGGRAFDLLLALIRSPGVNLPTDDLVSRAWPGRVVEKNTLHAQISELRRALAPDRSLIVTVPGIGYRFTGEVKISVTTDGWTKAAGLEASPLLRQTEMVGREGELAQAVRLVHAHRVVTVTGPGGCGKTEFAYRLVRVLAAEFPAGGVHAVELERMTNSHQVAMAVAASFGLRAPASEGSCNLLNAVIGERRALLLLDGCDHVIDAAARVAEIAERTGSALTVIATSREPIGASGEAVFRLGPLSVPSEHAADTTDLLATDSVRLFVAKALAVEPRFSLEATNLSLIARICRRLDGIPLAIEMAAVKAATLGTQWVASRLDDRLTVLRHGVRTSAPHQQTLEAMLDWSYERLNETDRTILQLLGTLPGTFSLQAARKLGASRCLAETDIVEGVRRLADKSLVMFDSSEGTTHYRLLETTRIYAQKKLHASGAGQLQ